MVGLLDGYRAALYIMKQATNRAGVVQTSCNLEGIFLTPFSGPSIGTVHSIVWLYSCMHPSEVRSLQTLPQDPMCCRRPSDQKPFARYMRDMRVTAS